MYSLDTSITKLPRIGAATAKKLAGLGIATVEDLLMHFPFRYEDYSRMVSIAQVKDGDQVSIRGTVTSIHTRRGFRHRVTVCEAIITDDTGSISAVWFNRPYVENYISKGAQAIFSGTISRRTKLQLVSPLYRPIEEGEGVMRGEIIPVYSATEGVSQKLLRQLVDRCLPSAEFIEDWLPAEVSKKHGLAPLAHAIMHAHRPMDTDTLAVARRRLAFDELFLIQAKSFLAKKELAAVKAPVFVCDERELEAYTNSLPYKLTDDQQKAAGDICRDLNKTIPMNRLLEGDVGSGKTAVASVALLAAARSKLQSVLLAPTEILAQQHFSTLSKLYANEPVRVGLLTHSMTSLNTVDAISRPELLRAVKDGNIDVVVGTHALIQEGVEYKTIGLIVVDEQHRFGVKQRSALKEKNPDGLVPHFLSMTATPIPRSLALIVYGDLDLSVLRQMPAGRKEIKTKLVSERGRKKAYEFIAAQIAQGRQAFVICPLIDPSDALGVASVTEEYVRLSNDVFRGYAIGLLHGKLKPKEKENIMRDFRANKIQILVSTSVIEVGIDVPNATVMMVEGAQRFGLAQLHQFRGRVGRGEHQSYCFLFTDAGDRERVERLRALEQSADGFAIAEYDLQHRGPGEVYGTRQSGIPDLHIAKLTDTALIAQTKEAVAGYFNAHELSESPALAKRLADMDSSLHLE